MSAEFSHTSDTSQRFQFFVFGKLYLIKKSTEIKSFFRKPKTKSQNSHAFDSNLKPICILL